MIRNLYILKTQVGINTLYQFVSFLFKLKSLKSYLILESFITEMVKV